jgi:hypothetical protein
MDERQRRIAYLARVNRCIQSAPAFLEELSIALGEPIHQAAFLSLRETDKVNASFRRGYGTAVMDDSAASRRYFNSAETELVFQLLDRLAGHVPNEPCLLLARQKNDCGAIRSRLDVLLRHAASVIKFDGDSLCAISVDQTQGFMVDSNPDDQRQTYEITVWGNKWAALTALCERGSD